MEMGILLDVFVAVFVMGITIYHINREFDHIDTDRLDDAEGLTGMLWRSADRRRRGIAALCALRDPLERRRAARLLVATAVGPRRARRRGAGPCRPPTGLGRLARAGRASAARS